MESKDKITTHYRKYYDIYDHIVLKMFPFYIDMHSEMIKQITRNKNTQIKILELGFGTGTLTSRIIKTFPNTTIVGIDNSKKLLAEAVRKLNKSDRFIPINADINKLKTDKQFNIVISALAIHHLSGREKQSLFKKLFKVLLPGGKIIIGDIVKSPKAEAWHKYLVKTMGPEGEHRWQIHKNNPTDKPSTIHDQRTWLKQAGFDHITTVNNWFNFYVFYGQKNH